MRNIRPKHRVILLWFLLVCLGCGAKPVPKTALPKPAQESKPIASEPPKEAAMPKVVEVKVDEFPSIAAALEELKRAVQMPSGTEQNAAIQRCEKWLQLQGNKPVDDLAAITKDKTAALELRMTTCRLLGQYSSAAVQPLCEIAADANEKQVRLRAMAMLVKLKPTPPEVVKLFIQLLDTTDNDILVQALYHLAKIGEPAAAATDQLQAMRQNHPNETVRMAAGDALKKVSPRRTFKDQ